MVRFLFIGGFLREFNLSESRPQWYMIRLVPGSDRAIFPVENQSAAKKRLTAIFG
jgi:hypothetical protein